MERLVYPIERWLPITDKSVPGVRPYYWISDLGRAFNTNINNFIPQFEDGKRSYLLITLMTNEGNKTKSVHRIVMIEFVGFDPDPQKTEVDHIYGDKYDNSVYSLRWATPSENVISAYDNNLMPSGEDSPLSVLSNEAVKNVCQMMQDGINRNEIYDYLIKNGIKNPGTVFNSIYNRIAWKRISKDYIFKDYSERATVFTDEEIHIVCKCLEQNMSHDIILTALGYSVKDLSRDKLNNLYTAISHIKKGVSHVDISSQYNIDSNSNKNVFTDEEIHYICRRFSQGAKPRQILTELGYNISYSGNRLEYYHYMNAIGKIKEKKNFTEISKLYNF